MYKKIAQAFLKNRQLSILLIITIFVLAGLSYSLTVKQYNPKITLPAFRIITEVPGATAEEVESLVTNEIETKLYEIPNVDETYSQSYRGGLSVVNVMFKIGEDNDTAKTQVYEKMYSNLDMAKYGVTQPIIKQINPENVSILTLAISSNTVETQYLRDLALEIKDDFRDLDSVTNIEIKGGSEKNLMVKVDQDKLKAYGLKISDIESIIKANNIAIPLGTIESENTYIPVEISADLNPDSLKSILVSNLNNEKIYISDIAEVFEGYEDTNTYVEFSKKSESFENSVFIAFSKREGTNGIQVAQEIKEKLSDYDFNDIALTIVKDDGKTAEESISGLSSNLLTSIIIVTIVLILFLRLRAAVIVALAIPLTLSLVFITGFAFSKTINRITLFALILSLGLLVDSATVIVENIYRHLKDYFTNSNISKTEKNKNEVISEAVNEVGTGLLLSTITSVIVFLPMSFITGMMGAYMGPIAFFVPAALIASLFVAYTITPYLSSVFLKESTFKSEKTKGDLKIEKFYEKKIKSILSSRKKRLAVIFTTFFLVVLTFSFPIIELIHFKMLPTADKEQFYVYIDLDESSTVEQTKLAADKITDLILSDDQVLSVQSYIGLSQILDFNGLFKGADSRNNPNQATLKVNISHPDDRAEKSADIVLRLRPLVNNLFLNQPETRIKFIEDPPGPPVQSTLQIRILGDNQEKREAIAKDLYVLLNETEGVVDIDTSISAKNTRRIIKIDHSKMSKLGLSAYEVVEALNTGISGVDIAYAHNIDSNELNNIFLKLAQEDNTKISDLATFEINGIYLSSFADFIDLKEQQIISHDNKENVTYLSAELADRSVVYAVKDLIFKLQDYRLDDGNATLERFSLFGFNYVDHESSNNYQILWGGEFEMTLENFRDLGLAMLVAFFFIYVILVAQFKSFKSPIFIMTSIVLAFGGVMPGFAVLDILGVPFTATSMIGLIALGGIVVNNSIILLEFIDQLVSYGTDLKSAIIKAAKTRMRPIFLTSMTTILGSLTIVSDPVWSGLAWAIIFGLSLSTVLTLLVFPVLYFEFTDKDKC